MAFLEGPRLRQRWNQIAHDAEAATENAAAGIWSIQHNYINPCLGSIAASVDQCAVLCLGNPKDRLRRRREREHARGGAEYSFDFYDDWYEDEQGGGLLGTWGGEDWDRLLAGTGSQRKHAGAETTEQPRRKRGMSYGTRGARRRTSVHDPTIIPSTQPIGFLGKLPWKLGGTLRYRPSAADLQDRPGKHGAAETEPLLGSDDDGSDYGAELRASRQRSGTTGSGDTSDSYRSRGDIFPSDGEGEEDAVPLDDDVTYDMIRTDDRSSGKTRSSKGKRPDEGLSGSRTLSRTTLGSTTSTDSPAMDRAHKSLPRPPVGAHDELDVGEERLRQEELEEMAMNKEAFILSVSSARDMGAQEAPATAPEQEPPDRDGKTREPEQTAPTDRSEDPARPDRNSPGHTETAFQAARLPKFG